MIRLTVVSLLRYAVSDTDSGQLKFRILLRTEIVLNWLSWSLLGAWIARSGPQYSSYQSHGSMATDDLEVHSCQPSSNNINDFLLLAIFKSVAEIMINPEVLHSNQLHTSFVMIISICCLAFMSFLIDIVIGIGGIQSTLTWAVHEWQVDVWLSCMTVHQINNGCLAARSHYWPPLALHIRVASNTPSQLSASHNTISNPKSHSQSNPCWLVIHGPRKSRRP